MAERRRLRPEVGSLGIAGVALLRLHARQDPSEANSCISEIRELLEVLDDDSRSPEERTPFLDVVSGYARWSSVYDLPGNPLVDCEEPAVRPILDGFEGSPVLDAACGTGRHLAYLAGRGHDVVGVDASPEMLEFARGKLPVADLRVGYLNDLPVGDSEVSGLVCALALDHVPELGPVYREFARVVRREGAIVVSSMHPVLRSVFGWGAWFIDADGKWDIPTHEHTIGDHLNAAVEAGLTLRRCLEVPGPESSLPSAPQTARIAYEAIPFVLVLHFECR